MAGHFRFDVNEGLEGMRAIVDIDAIWRDTYVQMCAIEEEETRKAVIQFLRERGYTIIEPEEANG